MKGIYLRCSNDKKERATLDTQQEACENYCKTYGWEYGEPYIDDGESGTTVDRHALQKLLRDAESGKIDGIVVWKLDRLSRNQRDFHNLMHDFKEWEVDFIAVQDRIDTSDPKQRIFMSVLAMMAEWEKDTIVERFKANKIRKLKENKWPGGKPPKGYKTDENKYLIVEEKGADIVKRIFELAAEYKTQNEILKRLGWKKEQQGTISKILKQNSYYTGMLDYHYEGETYPLKVPTIIDRELGLKVQKIMASKATYNRHNYEVLADDIKMKCATCGQNFIMDGGERKGGKYHYTLYRHKGKCKNGKGVAVNAKTFDEKLWESTVQKIRSVKELTATFKALKVKNLKEPDLTVYDKKVAKLDREADKFIEMMKGETNQFVLKHYRNEIKKIGDEIKRVKRAKEKEIEDFRERQRVRVLLDNAPGLVKAIRERYRNCDQYTFEEKKALIKEIYPVGSIKFIPKSELKEDFPYDLPEVITFKQGVFICMGYLDVDFYCDLMKKMGKFKFSKNILESEL